MTSTSENPFGLSNADLGPRPQGAPGNGPFMLTLCRLAAPVSIRPPTSPELKHFTFFTSSARQPDGSERLYLHMGYFETLDDAERWVRIARSRYPHAIATIAPAATPRQPHAAAPLSADPQPALPPRASRSPLEDASLSDTQVLRMLERRGAQARHDGDDSHCEHIALLRPEDTAVRHALKEAVTQGAAVFFAVQLEWSAQPIDLSRLPQLPIFKAYTLYATESHREGRSRYFLRLGFFADPVSAKQVAAHVLSSFAAAAVVPVIEEEVTRVREAALDGSSIPYLEQPRVGPAPDPIATDAPVPPPAPKPASEDSRRASRGPPTLEQTLKRMARREMLISPESVSDSGVRHLRIEVQRRSRRP
jgi:hypothetical protein